MNFSSFQRNGIEMLSGRIEFIVIKKIYSNVIKIIIFLVALPVMCKKGTSAFNTYFPELLKKTDFYKYHILD